MSNEPLPPGCEDLGNRHVPTRILFNGKNLQVECGVCNSSHAMSWDGTRRFFMEHCEKSPEFNGKR